MKLAVAVTIHEGKEMDTDMLKRFLISLYASDAPKDTMVVVVPVPGGHAELKQRRQEGVSLAMKAGTDVVVMVEQDFMLPKVWWGEFEKAFADSKVGIVGGRQRGNNVPPYIGDAKEGEPPAPFDWKYWTDYYFEGVWLNGIEGFVAFRREYLETGLGDMGGDPGRRFSNFPFHGLGSWKAVHLPQVVVGHNKYEKEERCPKCDHLFRQGPTPGGAQFYSPK